MAEVPHHYLETGIKQEQIVYYIEFNVQDAWLLVGPNLLEHVLVFYQVVGNDIIIVDENYCIDKGDNLVFDDDA